MKKRFLSGLIILLIMSSSIGIEAKATNINGTKALLGTEDINNENLYLEKSVSDESVDETLIYDGSFKTENGYINYNIENNEIIIEKYIGEDIEVDIPNEIDGKLVTTIKDYAFSRCVNLRFIDIPSSIIKIEDDAFYDCDKLSKIYVNENNKNYIDEDGVLFNKDKSILINYPIGKYYKTYKIPDTVITIGNSAFRNNTNLESIEIPNTVTKIGNNAFNYCIKLNSINIPSTVTEIGDYAFSLCSSLKNIEIPNTVTKIGDNAFRWCSGLTEINVPDSVLSIGDAAFSECARLTKINIDKNNKNYIDEDGVLFNKNKTKLIAYPSGKKEEIYEIPNSVTSIENYAFYTCLNLKNIEIPNTVINIGDSAFGVCTNLIDIEIPDSVTKIGDFAFSYCKGLKKINIPNSVIKIGKGGFARCENLTEIKVSNSLTSIEYGTFAYCKSLKEITIPDLITDIGIFAFLECTNLIEIKIPKSVTKIDYYAFADCSNLASIEIPDSVTSIENDAFQNCDNLTIYAYTNSYAQTYAEENSIRFKEIKPILEINNFTSNKVSPQVSGTIVELSVEATGTDKLQYKFILKDNKTGNWYKIRDFEKSNKCEWYTSSIGEKTLYVDVKDESGQVVRKSMNYTVKEKASEALKIINFSADKTSPQASRTKVILKAEAIGTGKLQYKFIISDNKGNWYKIKDFGTSNTAEWITSTIGNKTLYVDVKDENGVVMRKAMSYTVK